MEAYCEQEITMLDESVQKKRDSGDCANNDDEQQKKKSRRRSSLAATRRSITGLVPYLDSGSDLPSSSSSSTSSTKDSQNKLKPNPLNTRMDEIIQQFETNTSRLDREYAQWKLVLSNLEKEEEQSKLLSESNIKIQAEDIPQEIKDLARSEYITCDLMDFATMESRVEKRFRKTYFNIEKCLQDMRLFRETINTIKCHNGLLKLSIANDTSSKDSFGQDFCNELDTAPNGRGDMLDIKSQLEWLMNN